MRGEKKNLVILFPFRSKLFIVCHHYFCCSFFIRLYSYPHENQDLYLHCMLYNNNAKMQSTNVGIGAHCNFAMCTVPHRTSTENLRHRHRTHYVHAYAYALYVMCICVYRVLCMQISIRIYPSLLLYTYAYVSSQ